MYLKCYSVSCSSMLRILNNSMKSEVVENKNEQSMLDWGFCNNFLPLESVLVENRWTESSVTWSDVFKLQLSF